ncbi:MAG: dipeptidase, partial [Ktedonobacterales bacterium]
MTSTNSFPIFDGHNDALLHLYLPARGGGRSFFDRSERGHVDLPRARAGGLAGSFFAVFVPRESALQSGQEMPDDDLTITATGYEVRLAPAIERTYAQRVTIGMMALLFRLEAESQGQLTVARTTADIISAMNRGALAAVLHFEGAEAIDPELDALEVFYAAGLRSLGITWSRPNVFGHGVPFKYPASPDTGPGLTGAGRDLVRACNRLGILLDLAHLNERGFWDVAALST